ncbi:MAG TPA: hypothetical protein VFH95_06750 [Candidatus Kapabacteria bacterium]|nr:hypothetical protein [Candidatus Kapabacteria bacterium]
MNRKDSSFVQPDSSLHVEDIAWQFLAGEVAFNSTFFVLAGPNVLRPSAVVGPFMLGLLGAWVATPLAIHYTTTTLLHLKSGDWGFSILGAVLGSLAGIPLSDWGKPSQLKEYLGLSLGIITFAELFYDFTIWVLPSK